MAPNILAGLVILLATALTAAAQNTLHVDPEAPNNGPGNDWAHAFHYLADALAAAGPGDELRIAAGVYRPDQTTAQPGGSGDRFASFVLPQALTLRGGFAGSGHADPDEQDPAQFPSILSGDIGVGADTSDNSLHVLTLNADEPTRLESLTITMGNADASSPDEGGGGALILAGQPAFVRCVFRENEAFSGGGVNVRGGAATFTDCEFLDNSAGFGGGIDVSGDHLTLVGCRFRRNIAESYGGGIFSAFNDGMSVIGCTFSDNHALSANGGAISFLLGSDLRLTESSFYGNTAGSNGGALEFGTAGANPVTSCVFSGNAANYGGAAVVFVFENENLVFANCSFVGNEASTAGGAIRIFGGSRPVTSANCVFWNNAVGGIVDEGSHIGGGGPAAVRYCCVQDADPDDDSVPFGGAMNGNIDDDPLLANADGPDDIAGTDDDNLRLMSGSPAIDAADSTVVPRDVFDLDFDGCVTDWIGDADGHDRFFNDLSTADTGVALLAKPVVDMGAFEFGSAAPPASLCPGDMNCDSSFDGADIDAFFLALGFPDDYAQQHPGCDMRNGDVNEDGVLDGADIQPFFDLLGG